jgi:cell division protein FtsZ
MTEMGKAMMGTGEASGEDRALMAAQNAIQNPLLDEVSLKGAKAVLVNVTGGPDMTLLEVDEACNAISAEVDPDANTIFGAAFDDSLQGKIRVSVVATGMDGASISAIEPKAIRITVPAPRAAETAPPAPAPAPKAEPFEELLAGAPDELQVEPEAEPVLAEAEALEPVAVAAEAEPEKVLKIIDPVVDGAREVQLDLEPAIAQSVRAAETEAVDDGDSPLFIPARRAQAQHKNGGWLSLFGARRYEAAAEEEPMPQFRNMKAGTAEIRTTVSAQPAEEEAEQDDLEIPSFLRRLAN